MSTSVEVMVTAAVPNRVKSAKNMRPITSAVPFSLSYSEYIPRLLGVALYLLRRYRMLSLGWSQISWGDYRGQHICPVPSVGCILWIWLRSPRSYGDPYLTNVGTDCCSIAIFIQVIKGEILYPVG